MCHSSEPAGRRSFAFRRPRSGLVLKAMLVLGACSAAPPFPGARTAAADPPSVLFSSSERPEGDETYPRLEAQFTDGSTSRIPRGLVFDAEILESVPDSRRDRGQDLEVRNSPGARSVVLLGFDAAGWLAAAGRTPADIALVDFVLHEPAVFGPKLSLRLPLRLELFAPPPGSTWDSPTLAGLALSWNDARASGVAPADALPAYPAASRLAALDTAEGRDIALEVRGSDGLLTKLVAPRSRFFGRALTDHVRDSAAAGKLAKLILFTGVPPVAGPGAAAGVWPDSRRVDHRGTGRPNAAVAPPLRLEAEVFEDLVGGPTIAVVSDKDVLTLVAGSRLLSFDTGLHKLAETTDTDICPSCEANGRRLFLSLSQLLLLSDGTMAVFTVEIARGRPDTPHQLKVFVLNAGDLSRIREIDVGGRETARLDSIATYAVASPAGGLYVITNRGRLFSVNTAAGSFVELSRPGFSSATFTDIAVDDAGNLFISGTESAGGTRSRVVSLDREGNERFQFERAGASLLGAPIILVDGRVALSVGAAGPAATQLLILGEGGKVDDEVTVPPMLNVLSQPAVRRQSHLDGLDRIVFEFGPETANGPLLGPPVSFAYSPSRKTLEKLDGFGVLPLYPLLGGGYVGQLTNRNPTPGGVSNAIFDDTGFPLGVEHLDRVGQFTRPSSRGLFTTFRHLDNRTGLRHYAEGGEFVHVDLEPVDFFAPVNEGGRTCLDDALFRGRGLLLPFQPSDVIVRDIGVSGLPQWGVEGPAAGGSVLFGPFVPVFCPPPASFGFLECPIFFCAATRPGPLYIWPKWTPPPAKPEALTLWTTARRVMHAGGGPGALIVSPFLQTLAAGESARLTASRDGSPVDVEWSLSTGADLVASPLPDLAGAVGGGPEIVLELREDTRGGRVTVLARDEDGFVATGVVVVQPAARLVPLDNDPNLPVSRLRQGGTAFRYYRLVAGPPGGESFPPLKAVFRVPAAGTELSASGFAGVPSDWRAGLAALSAAERGLLTVPIPYDALKAAVAAVPSGPLDVVLDRFEDLAGNRFAPREPHVFQVSVEPRTFSRKLDFSTEATLSADQARAVLSGRGAVSFEDFDARTPGSDVTKIEAGASGGGGASVTPVELDLGIAGRAIESPKAQAILRSFVETGFRFEPADADPAVQDLALNLAIQSARLGGLGNPAGLLVDTFDPFNGALHNIIDVIKGELTLEAILRRQSSIRTGFQLKLVPLEVKLVAKQTVERPGGAGKKDSFFLEFSGINIALKGDLSVAFDLTPRDPPVASPVSVRLSLNGSFELLKIGGLGLVFCPLDACIASGYSEEVKLNPDGTLKSISITLFSSGSPTRKTWTVEGEAAHEALRANCNAITAGLAALGFCTDCVECPLREGAIRTLRLGTAFDPSILGIGLDPIGGLSRFINEEVLRLFRTPHTLAKAEWTLDQLQSNEGSVAVGVKVEVGLKVALSRLTSQESLRTAGVLFPSAIGLVEFPRENYLVPDPFQPALNEAGLLSRLGDSLLGVGDLVSSSFLRAEFQAFANQESLFDHLTKVGGGGEIGPQTFIVKVKYNRNATVTIHAWTKDAPDPAQPFLRRATGDLNPRRVDVVLGTFHDFSQQPAAPAGLAAIVSGSVIIGYPQEEADHVGESNLAIARWNTATNAWELLGGQVDSTLNTVTGNITKEGTYAVVAPVTLGCPALAAPAVGADQVRLSWSRAPEAQVIGYSVYRGVRGEDDLLRIAVLDGAEATSFADPVPADEVRTLRYAVASRISLGGEGCLSNVVETDLDNDDVSDLFELASGLTVGTDNGAADRDGDKVSDLQEVLAFTNPGSPDTDGDGIGDGEEGPLGTDPRDSDSDADGLDDGDESARGTHPLFSDTDLDGLSDGDEVAVHRSDPLDRDSDDDALPDADETLVHRTSPILADTDADGISDPQELLRGTDPARADSDGDNAADGVEVQAGADPLDRTSVPDGVPTNLPPKALFTAAPLQGVVPLKVQFDGSASSDADGELVLFSWDFGDGEAAHGPVVSHTYEVAGGFTAKLTVKDDGGAQGAATVAISVSPAAGGLIRPGDANADGLFDLSDPIALLGHLFQGFPAQLPCAGGSTSSPGNRSLVDCNGDGIVDLSDAVCDLGFLFLGGPPPQLGTACVEIVGCPAACR